MAEAAGRVVPHPIVAATCVVWCASVGALFLSLQPMVVGALVDDVGMTLQQAGNVASANMLGQLLGAIGGFLLIRRVALRWLLLAGLVLLPAGDVLSAALTTSPGGLALARTVAGTGVGLSLACAFASVAALANPARVFAAVLFFQTLTGSIALYVAPTLFEQVGLRPTFFGLAALGLTSIAWLPWFAAPARTVAVSAGQSRPVQMATVLLLASLLVHYVANNAVWAHFDRIGAAFGVAKDDIGFALSIGQLCSLAGPVAAAILSTRISSRAAIAGGCLLIAASTLALLRVPNAQYLLASVAVFIGSIGFIVPFYLTCLAEQDPTGRQVMMGKLAIMAGLVVGPTLAAAVVTAASLQVMTVGAAALFATALMLAWASLSRA